MRPRQFQLPKKIDNYLLIADTNQYDRLLNTVKILSDKSSRSIATAYGNRGAQAALRQPIWIYSNMNTVGRIFGPVLKAQFDQIKTMTEQQQAQANQPQMVNIGPVMAMYSAGFDKFFNEVQFITLSANPKPDQLDMTFSITPVPGTDLAEMMKAVEQPQDALQYAGYISNNAIFNVAGKWNTDSLKKFYQAYWDVLSVMINSSDDNSIQKLKDMTNRWADMMGSHMAMSFYTESTATPPFGFTSIVEIKDASNYDQMMKEYVEFMKEGFLNDFYKNLGIDMTFNINDNAYTYKGVKVSEGNFAIKASTDSPEGQMIQKMYGDGLSFCWAMVDNKYISVMAQDNKAAVCKLIDQVKSGEAPAGGFEKVAQSLPARRPYDGVVSLNLVQGMNMIMNFIPHELRGDQPVPTIPSSSCITMGSRTMGRRSMMDIIIPKQHLQELMGGIAMMQMQMQKVNQK